MQLITFTSDFGQDDYYEAALKGAIYAKVSSSQIVDISNNVEPYDIIAAAFLVKNAYPSFPKGTIHVVSVDNYYSPDASFLLVECEGQYFLGPDNGVLYMIIQGKEYNAYKIKLTQKSQILDHVYANTIQYIANDLDLSEVALPTDKILERTSTQPIVQANVMRGIVLHVDHYGNAITNIDKALFERMRADRRFGLFYKPRDPILKMSTTYSDIEVGGILCFFNASDLLEIAVNKGKASTLLGLNKEDRIQVVFEEEG